MVVVPVDDERVGEVALYYFACPRVVLLMGEIALAVFFYLVVVLVAMKDRLVRGFVSLDRASFPDMRVWRDVGSRAEV